jgi:RNA polymerase sigma factor (sigma-70 family)
VADDNRERFELLYHQNFRAVLRYALARLDPERARDVTAETFLIAWRRIGDVPAEPTAWLYGVARKVIAGQLRTDARRDALRDRLVLGGSNTAADPADQVAQRDSALGAVARLGELDREVLKLVAWDGLPARVAAEVLGMSRMNFAVRLHRARRRLDAELAAADSAAARPAPARHAAPTRVQPVPDRPDAARLQPAAAPPAPAAVRKDRS